jgi:hypothetical protein
VRHHRGLGRRTRARSRRLLQAISDWREVYGRRGRRHYGAVQVEGGEPVAYAYHGDASVRPLIEELVQAAARHMRSQAGEGGVE